MLCPYCDGYQVVCEAHDQIPWEGPRACTCGAPGMRCPWCAKDAKPDDKSPGWRVKSIGAK